MKKLLSILSILTISGTAMPNVIAASNYEKHNIQKRQVKFKPIFNEIKVWYLGELSDNLPETILNRVYKLNKNIKTDSIRILNVQQNKAKIIWNNDLDNTTNFVNVFLELII